MTALQNANNAFLYPISFIESVKLFLDESKTPRKKIDVIKKHSTVSHGLASFVLDYMNDSKVSELENEAIDDLLCQIEDSLNSLRDLSTVYGANASKYFDITINDLINIQFRLSNILADRLLANR